MNNIGRGVSEKSGSSTIFIIAAVFFIFGFVTWLNGPLITFVKLTFTLSDSEAYLILMVFYLSYLVFALPSAMLLRRIGMKKGMVVGLLTMSLGTALFGNLVAMHLFPSALVGLFVIGCGLALLQTASNPYVILAGPPESAARRVAIMGICNKSAGLLAPIIFGLLIMKNVGDLPAQIAATPLADRNALLQSFANGIYAPYMAMAAILALLGIGVYFSPLAELRGSNSAEDNSGKWHNVFRHHHLLLGVAALFCYVGVEVMAGDIIGTYGEALGLPVQHTAYFTSLTLAGMLTGYIVGLVTIPRMISQETYLKWSAILGVAAVVGAYSSSGYVSVGFVALLGFANAMMWPTIFPLAIRGLGRHTEVGSAFLVMAISGGAVFPQLFGLLKKTHDFQLVFLALMVPAYLFILYFAVSGHKETCARVGFVAHRRGGFR